MVKTSWQPRSSCKGYLDSSALENILFRTSELKFAIIPMELLK